MIRTTLAGLALAAAFAVPALGQTWPDRPIKLIVPFPPGGGTDVVTRVVANGIGNSLGQPIVIENKGGAGGTLGNDLVAKAAPDGYTIGTATSSTLPASVILRKDVPYDPAKSFAPITLIGTTPYVLVGSMELKPTTFPELVAFTKANAGKVNYASVGVTTLGYLLSEQLKLLTGIDMTHIPYRGASAAYPDVISNQVSLFLDNPTVSAGRLRDGKLRAYSINGKSAALPSGPTFDQLGVKDFDTQFWYGLIAPAGTPRPIVEKIQKAVADFVASPAGKAELESKDVTPVGSTPDAFAALVATDMTRLKALADKIGVKPE